jgi:hypothetical protein
MMLRHSCYCCCLLWLVLSRSFLPWSSSTTWKLCMAVVAAAVRAMLACEHKNANVFNTVPPATLPTTQRRPAGGASVRTTETDISRARVSVPRRRYLVSRGCHSLFKPQPPKAEVPRRPRLRILDPIPTDIPTRDSQSPVRYWSKNQKKYRGFIPGSRSHGVPSSARILLGIYPLSHHRNSITVVVMLLLLWCCFNGHLPDWYGRQDGGQ